MTSHLESNLQSSLQRIPSEENTFWKIPSVEFLIENSFCGISYREFILENSLWSNPSGWRIPYGLFFPKKSFQKALFGVFFSILENFFQRIIGYCILD